MGEYLQRLIDLGLSLGALLLRSIGVGPFSYNSYLNGYREIEKFPSVAAAYCCWRMAYCHTHNESGSYR